MFINSEHYFIDQAPHSAYNCKPSFHGISLALNPTARSTRLKDNIMLNSITHWIKLRLLRSSLSNQWENDFFSCHF
ncbi:hypothetical protein H744_1c1294 [Photobacterium gaetbulicola Gung47]|uniref:Uncharacterized protein n=1 Tax=Photobacterium gaetbulicola Gung47 TaxID=658445 RepID=A0A0C5WJE2_9GAMM|nr:hypothetical protein H744_1c1294 [Photobacterium gaetbulicola Gung47]